MMDVLISFLVLLLLNILTLVLPALLAAWLFTLVLAVPFDQMVWLSIGVLLVIRYIILSIADAPGQREIDMVGAIITPVVSLVLLALSGLCGWILLNLLSLDLTMFQAVLLFAISLTAGAYFTARSGTGGLPGWMTTFSDINDEIEEDDFIIPAKRPRKRKNRTSRR
jgi:hypothetical protein